MPAKPSAPTYSPEVIARQAEMLGNRVRKVFRHRKSQFARQGITAFRLYDRDIPEIRAVVDWYDGHVILGEYVRTQTDDPAWVESMAASVASALQIPLAQVHIRRRTTRPKDGDRYQRLARTEERHSVEEGGLRFLVNMHDYLDVGLFLDHRITRSLVQGMVAGKSFLNLFAYTGAFTTYAVAGGATTTTSVDLSQRYLSWAQANLTLNGFDPSTQEWVSREGREFIAEAAQSRRRWDVIFLDPPSFSTREGMPDFDVGRDHRSLVESCLRLLKPGGVLLFSTNHQRFEPQLAGLRHQEITAQTLPVDFTGRTPHRLFRFDAD